MKTYITITILTFMLTILSFSSKDSTTNIENIDKPNYRDSLSLIKSNRDSLLLDMQKDIDSFKISVDSIVSISKEYNKELNQILIQKQTENTAISEVVTDTIKTVKKKKTWIKRTIDKIKN